jgi:integrase
MTSLLRPPACGRRRRLPARGPFRQLAHAGQYRPVKAKYTAARPAALYASWCINRKVDGGLELSAKVVQDRLGHANIAMTLDTYGHLFPRGDDGKELAEAELRLIG